MLGRPRKACEQCNRRKLRCVGTKPVCDRCKRLDRECDWGDARALRSSLRQRPLLSRNLGSSSQNIQTANEIPLVSEVPYTGIPPKLVLQLVEVYFSCLYSAPLIFHKPTLLHDLRVGSVKSHVILSTCALASRSSQTRNDLRNDGFSTEWAEQAGRLALLEAEKPNDDILITFINLGLFWYSRGYWKRSIVYEGYAVLNVRLLQLSEGNRGEGFTLSSEVRRRRFWASFLVNQFVSEPSFPRVTSSSVSDILLPIAEDDFEKGVIPAHDIALQKKKPSQSIFAELIRIMSLWTEIQEATTKGKMVNASNLSTIQPLDVKLRQWRSSLLPDFDLSAEGTISCNEDIRPRILLLHAVYLNCMCALHCSIVPLFSLSKSEGLQDHIYSQRISAQVAYESACEITDLVRTHLEHAPSDAYRWPGFVGFALYCSCAIQLPFMWSSSIDWRRRAQKNIRDNLSAMVMIGQNWRYVGTLVINVKRLYQHHSSHAIQLDGPPSDLSASQLAGERGIMAGVDNIWEHRRLIDQGKLTDQGLETNENTANKTPRPSTTNDMKQVPARYSSPETSPKSPSGIEDTQHMAESAAVPSMQSTRSISPILSHLFPDELAKEYDEDEYAMFLSTVTEEMNLDLSDQWVGLEQQFVI